MLKFKTRISIFLSTIAFVSSFAAIESFAGELDGKGLYCKNLNETKSYYGYVFKNRRAYFIFITGYSLRKEDIGEYLLAGLHRVMFKDTRYGYIDRRTLRHHIPYDARKMGTPTPVKCKLVAPVELERTLRSKIKNAKIKNKL